MSIRNYFSIFFAEYATLIVVLCCTKYEYIMYIHERDNWTDFRWDASEVSLLQEIVFRKQYSSMTLLLAKRNYVLGKLHFSLQAIVKAAR